MKKHIIFLGAFLLPLFSMNILVAMQNPQLASEQTRESIVKAILAKLEEDIQNIGHWESEGYPPVEEKSEDLTVSPTITK